MTRITRTKIKRSRRLATLLGFMLALALTAAVLLAVQLGLVKSEQAKYRESTARRINELDTQLLDEREKLKLLQAERDLIYSQSLALQGDVANLTSSAADSAKHYSSLDVQLDDLKGQLNAKDAEIDKLKANIKNLESVYSVDINKQFDIITELNELLVNVPPIEFEREVTKDDGTVEKIIDYRIPKISIYYEDMQKGYKYSYLADEVYSSASLLKAPFALSILEAAEKEFTDRKAQLEANPTAVLPEPKYNFDKIYTYTKADYQSGSGKIKDEPEGKTYTYRELIEYLLLYSDNVAYEQLKKEYDIREFRSLASRIGTKAMRKSLSDISAADGGKVMRAIYEYIQSEGEYSELMYDSMVNSAHTVMITMSVYPKKVAHKYGWDAGTYHDMGIVYDENPYVVVVLTDMEEGGKEINEYIQSVIKKVAKLHANFYAKR